MIVAEKTDLLHNQISFEQRQKELDEIAAQEELARKKEKQSPYNEFAQFNMENYINTTVMMNLADSPAATKLFWFITKHMDGYNALIASYKVFEEALDMSTPTVSRGIKILKDRGVLHIKKSGSANVYILNPQLVWKSWGSNLKYCEFPAKVILAESEQYPDAREIFSKQMHRVMDKKDKKEN